MIAIRKINKIIIAALFLTILAALAYSTYTYANKDMNNPIDKAKLKRLVNMEITEIDEPSNIDEKQAIDIVKTKYPELAKESKTIKAYKVLLTHEGCGPISEEVLNKNAKLKEKGYPENLPVWIVVVDGVEIKCPSGKPPLPGSQKESEQKPGKDIIATESNIVIDAETGEPLYIFMYKYK